MFLLVIKICKKIIPINLLNSPLASCSLRNFGFLLLNTLHFDKRIILSFLALTTFGFLLSVPFLHFKK